MTRAGLVSFDLFDTLARRPFLEPGHLFAWMEAHAGLAGFAAKRVAAERTARERHRGRSDVTLAQIHGLLPDRHWIGIEFACEVRLAYPRARVAAALRSLQKSGKPVAILTDTYLDRRTVEAIAAKAGAHPHHLVISCEDGVTKCDGSSYLRLAEMSGVGAGEILHIGDNPETDFDVPAALGIASVHIARELPERLPRSRTLRTIFEHLREDGSLPASVACAALRDSVEELPEALRNLQGAPGVY